jgi:hypothetical protein
MGGEKETTICALFCFVYKIVANGGEEKDPQRERKGSQITIKT